LDTIPLPTLLNLPTRGDTVGCKPVKNLDDPGDRDSSRSYSRQYETRSFKCEAAPTAGMLAIAGGKGGCGKTTTTLALARALSADHDATPVVVDADCDMPDLHVLAGTPLEPGLDALDERPPSAVAHASDRVPGVRVVPAGTARTAGKTLDAVRRLDGTVLVDCPAGASPAVADPLRLADATLLVSTATPESLEDAAKTAAMARTLGADPVGTVLTKTDRPLTVSTLLGCPLLETVPEVSGDVLTSDSIRRAYRSLARTLREQKA
jgi:septum site-determining protein MinD